MFHLVAALMTWFNIGQAWQQFAYARNCLAKFRNRCGIRLGVLANFPYSPRKQTHFSPRITEPSEDHLNNILYVFTIPLYNEKLC